MTDAGWGHVPATLRATMRMALVFGALATPALAQHAPVPSKPETAGGKSEKSSDPILAIGGSASSWSVSRTDAGCYAMSPVNKTSSRIAIGRHPTLGAGMFVIDLGLAVSRADNSEPVVFLVAGERHQKTGRMVANRLLFIPLTPPDIEAEFEELKENGVIWLEIRQAFLGHGGREARETVAAYGETCRNATGKPE